VREKSRRDDFVEYSKIEGQGYELLMPESRPVVSPSNRRPEDDGD
jgi:hypothetical protein